MPLKDMALTADEAKETMLGYAVSDPGEAPKYPYGLALDLNDEVMKKLGMTSLPTVGSSMLLSAEVKVTRVSAYEEQDGAEQCFGLQITAMDLSAPAKPSTAADKLYGGDKE